MKFIKTKKSFVSVGVIFLALICFSSNAFAWGSATHAYIDDHLYKKRGLTDPAELNNRIYGANGPDVFNYMFNAYYVYLYPQTHNNFMAVWKNANTENEKALAYGFVSHNDVWGADFTAHHSGKTYGRGEGYIVAKAYELKSKLQQVPEFNALGLPDSVALEVSHNLVESGVDILTKRLDPGIGQKLMDSAINRSDEFPALLSNAYATGLAGQFGINQDEAAGIIHATEGAFRDFLIGYGYILTKDEATALQMISEQMAGLAINFLDSYGIPLVWPDGTAITSADLLPLIQFAISTSMEICANDFEKEIRATTGWANGKLSSNGITY